jgi:hypothetical protein
MPGYGRGGKPKAGFPPCPQPLEIAKARFPHSHRPDDAGGTVEIQKQDLHCSTGLHSYLEKEERRPGGRSLRSQLQAHLV